MLSEIKYGKVIPGEVIDFTQIECGGCGIPFFVPTRWQRSKVEEKGGFTCPNGCERVYTGKSDKEKLKEQLEQERQRHEFAEAELHNRILDEINAKKKVEKQLKRVHKGTCPCCNRSFHNLQQHIQNQHPELLGTHEKAKASISSYKKKNKKSKPQQSSITKNNQ